MSSYKGRNAEEEYKRRLSNYLASKNSTTGSSESKSGVDYKAEYARRLSAYNASRSTSAESQEEEEKKVETTVDLPAPVKKKTLIQSITAADEEPEFSAGRETGGGGRASKLEEIADMTLAERLASAELGKQEAAQTALSDLLSGLAKVGKSGDSTLPLNNATQVINDIRDNPDAVQQAMEHGEEINAEKQAEAKQMQEWANEHKVAASAASVVSSPLSMVDYLQQLVEMNAVGHSIPSEDLKPAEITQTLREGVSEDMGNVGKFLYNTAMSGVDSLVGGALGGGVPGVGGLILSGGAASSAMNDILQRGGSDQQAVIGGAAAGAFEAIFETISIGQLSALKEMPVDSAKAFFTNMVKSVITNASEETATELANVLLDSFLMQDLSDYSLMVDELMAKGYNQSDAERLAKLELAKQVGLAGLAGGLMGAAFGGVGSLGGYLNNRTTDTEGAQLLRNALNIKEAPAQAEQTITGSDTASTQPEQSRLSNKQVERMIRDEATMKEMGIDTNGKTMRQLRDAVRAKLAEQEQGAETSSEESGVQPPSQETAPTANPVASQAETRRRMNMGEAATAVLGENGAKAFRTAYNQDVASRVDEQTAATGFNTVYKATLDGRAMTEDEQAQTVSLPESMRMAAESSARMDRQRASQAKYFGENAMLVRDDNFKKMHLASKTVRTLDAVAKVAGVQVRFVEQVEGGDASYKDGVVLLSMKSENPVTTLFTHEIVHRIRETSPQSYNAMAEFVQKYMSETSKAVNAVAYASAYETSDVSFYTEEMVADAFGTILQDGKAMERFVQDNRTAAEKVLDAIRDFINAIKRALNHQNVELSAEQRKAFRDLESQFSEMEKIMESALKSVPSVQKENAAPEGSVARFKVKYANGKQIVWIENSGLTNKQLSDYSVIEAYIAEHIGEVYTIIESGQKVYIGEDLPGEFTHSKYTNSLLKNNPQALKAKKKAASEFGLLIETATNRRWEKTKHTESKDAKYGMYRYDTAFAFPVKTADGTLQRVRSYDAELLIRNASDGKKYLYDIVGVKENTTDSSDLAKREIRGGSYKAAASGSASDGSVTQPSPTVKPESGAEVVGDSVVRNSRRTWDNTDKNRLIRDLVNAGFEQDEVRKWISDVVERFVQEYKKSHPDTKYSRPIDPETRREAEEAVARYVEQYGAIPPGENPARVIEIPRRTERSNKVSQTVRTILEAQATPDEMVPDIEKLVADGKLSYSPISDESAVNEATDIIERDGWDQVQRDWFKAMGNGVVSKSNTTMGWLLYNNAANTGNTKLALDILNEMVKSQRSAAQALQATRILKTLSPETQLYGAQKSVEGLTEELKKRYGDDIPDLKIDPALAEKFLNARTDKGRAEAMQEIYRDIGRQMPSRFIDKFNAWRYLAMLGNPRTHVRNIVGNAGFAPVVAAKNLTAAGIERLVLRNRDSRTKSVAFVTKEGRALLKAAWADYANVTESMPDGKYSDLKNANRYIEEGRVIFGRGEGKTAFGRTLSNTAGKLTEKVRRFNSGALAYEDMWFAKPHYASALAQYCKAHGITVEELQKGTSKRVGVARNYAMREAQKATYQDANEFSEFFSRLGRNPSNKKTAKAMNALVEGVLPFRKTPANILVRSVEYSPLGLVRGLKNAIVDVRKGKVTAAEAIDRISSGLTGTALLGLGVWLAAEGLVRGHGDDEKEKEKDFTELQGHQGYALELPDGTSITLDWLAPEALPFFIGVNLWEMTSGMQEAPKMGDILGAVSNVSEPLLEMSCLQGLNDLLDSVGYASSEGLASLPQVLISSATSLLTQMVPTLLGQIERSGEPVRMTTYTDKNKFLDSDTQYFLGRVTSRIPGLDYGQIPYIDAWGREEAAGSPFERAINNFLNPAYMSEVKTSAMEQELERLYTSVGETELLPSRAPKYFTVSNETVNLTAEQYVEYATFRGHRAYDLLTELTESKRYSGLDDKLKASAVKKCYSVANEEAKALVSEYKLEKFHQDMDKAEAAGISGADYILFYVAINDMSSVKDSKGNVIKDVQSQVRAWLEKSGFTRKQKETLWSTRYKSAY